MQEQELFQSYEVKNWDFSPRIYKILAVSAIFNILALFIIGQTNLLTTKGCDSPLVGGVCQVLDTLYVGGTALATDTRTIDDPDSVTDLGDAEIIWVDRTGDEDFKYPEGYFALSNPELQFPQEIPNADGSFPTTIPGIPNPIPGGGGTADLLSKPQELPQPNNNAVSGNLPSSPFTIDENPTVTRGKTPRVRYPKVPKNNPTLNNNSPNTLDPLGNTTANTQTKDPNKQVKNPDEDKVEEVVINKAPLKTLAADVKTKVLNKEVDLSQNFKVVADGVIDKDGKLLINTDKKTKKPIFIAEGDEKMVELVTGAIAAVGNSGWLGHLRTQGVDKIKFTVVQDNDNLQVIITSDLATPERANTVSGGLNGVIQTAFLADKNNIRKLGEDERVLLTNAKVSVNPTNTKQFVLNFVLPKQTAQEMITRKLNEPQENPAGPKQNVNTGQIKENKQNTAK
jgi:hypothetical protein